LVRVGQGEERNQVLAFFGTQKFPSFNERASFIRRPIYSTLGHLKLGGVGLVGWKFQGPVRFTRGYFFIDGFGRPELVYTQGAGWLTKGISLAKGYGIFWGTREFNPGFLEPP